MKRICEDCVDYGTEKDFTEYFLDVENETLLIHTLCIQRKGKNSHVNELCKLTTEQAQLLNDMSEEDCMSWCLNNQWRLPEISRE